MRIVVLGSAAGGGFPQWNSGATACRRARSGDPAARPRTQTSIAVSGDGQHWVLINASPDLRQQIDQTPVLHPRPSATRSSPMAGVVLTGGEVDVIAGLLSLRERQAFDLFATRSVLDVLAANPIFDVLARETVGRHALGLEEWRDLPGGLRVSLFAVPGKVPLYLETDDRPSIEANEQTVGAHLTDGESALFFIPGCAAMTPALADRLRGASTVMFDGTLWADDEMVAAGLGPKTGARMGHMSVSGPGGTLAAFDGLGVDRRILIHLNNSNPVLLDDSPERAAVHEAGWIVAHDGMELTG